MALGLENIQFSNLSYGIDYIYQSLSRLFSTILYNEDIANHYPNLSYRIDQRTGNKYIFIDEDFNIKYVEPKLDNYLKEKAAQSYGKIALIDGDAVLRIKDGSQLIFKGKTSDDIREYLFDEQSHPYTISFRTASLHTYMMLTKKNTGESFYFGLSNKIFDTIEGKSCLRDDKIFEQTYYIGHNYLEPLEKMPVVNSTSCSMSFDIEIKQVEIIEQFLKDKVATFMNDEVEYVFLKNNCMHFAQELFSAIFDDEYDHFGAYYIDDRLDLRNWGLYQIFVENTSYYNIFIKNISFFVDLVLASKTGKTFDKVLSDIYLKLQSTGLSYFMENKAGNTKLHINAYLGDQLDENLLLIHDIDKKNDLGETALYIALENSNIEFALQAIDLGADVSLPNNAGISPLFKVFEINKDLALRNLLVTTVIQNATDVNSFETTCFVSPLIQAVKYNDLNAIKLLIAKGVDIYAANIRNENAAYVAAKYQSEDVYNFFLENYPTMIDEQASFRTLCTAKEYWDAVKTGDNAIYNNPTQINEICFSDIFDDEWHGC